MVEDCSALDDYEQRYGPVPRPSRHRLDADGDIIVPIVRINARGGGVL